MRRSVHQIQAGRSDILRPVPDPPFHNLRVKIVNCGAFESFVVTDDNQVFVQRKYEDGFEIVGMTDWSCYNPFIPLSIPCLDGQPVTVQQLRSGYNFTMLLYKSMQDNLCTILSMGSNSQGQLAQGKEPVELPSSNSFQPCVISIPSGEQFTGDIKSLDCGSMHTAFTDSKCVFASGWNKYHQCGVESHGSSLLRFEKVDLPEVYSGSPIESVHCTLHHTIVKLSSTDLLLLGERNIITDSTTNLGDFVHKIMIQTPISSISTHYSSDNIALVPTDPEECVLVGGRSSTGDLLTVPKGVTTTALERTELKKCTVVALSNQFSVTISTSCEHQKNCTSSVLLTLYSKEEPKRDDTRLRNYNVLSVSTHADSSGLMLLEYKPEAHFPQLAARAFRPTQQDVENWWSLHDTVIVTRR